MKRGESQVFFNHLPGQMQRDSDMRFITIIDSETKDCVQSSDAQINAQGRIFKEAELILKSDEFQLLPHAERLRPEDYLLREIKGATQTLFPAVFQCNECHHINRVDEKKVRSEPDKAYWLASCGRKDKDDKRACGSRELTQMSLVFVHECGWIAAPKPSPCEEHGWNYIRKAESRSQQVRDLYWECGICHQSIAPFFEVHKVHSGCKYDYRDEGGTKKHQGAMSRPYQDPSTYQRVGFTLINHGESHWSRLVENDQFKEQLLKVHLGRAAPDSLFGQQWDAAAQGENAIDEDLRALAGMFSVTVDDLKALILAQEGNGVTALQFLKSRRPGFEPHHLQGSSLAGLGVAESALASKAFMDALMDYYQLLDRQNRAITTWQHWEDQAINEYGFGQHALDETRLQFQNLGLEDILYTNRFPVAHVAIGYTRGRYGSKKALQLFPVVSSENTRRPFYVHSLDTEAIVFKLNPVRLVSWLHRRGHDAPETPTREEAMAFLANNVHHDALESAGFAGIEDALSKDVYTCIHTFSHALLKTANEFSGDDSTSFSEIILPGIPAFIIYHNKRAKFTTGGMQYTYQRHMLPWLKTAHSHLAMCINDPTCRTHASPTACFGCVQGSEIGCAARNKHLDRRRLFPFPDNADSSYWT